MSAQVKLECNNVWKLYGVGAEALMRDGNEPDDKTLAEAGVVGAIKNANVHIHEGEIFVIMGLSGSGKSTLVRCLSRLIRPTSGEIQFDGDPLLSMSDAQLIELRRKKVGMVFQNFALLPHLTVLQNVAFPLDVQGVKRSTRDERAREIIETVGLAGREDYFPRQLSGGQQQRVGIARSLVGNPEVWFLDEPFSALDPLIRRGMQDEFLRLQSRLKKTIVFITHDFDEAIRLADRIAIMKDGRIVQTATPEELVLNPASEYVAEFTRNVAREKVIRIHSLLQPYDSTVKVAGDLDAGLLVSEVADKAEASKKPYRVVDEAGNPLGLLYRQSVIDILVGRSAK